MELVPTPTAAEQSQYEKIVAEVWTLSAELEEAKQHLAEARQKLKKTTTAEGFRKAQQIVDQAQQEVLIKDKKLDLAGSNLDIQDFKRKKGSSASPESMPLADRLKMMREELFPSTGKAAPAGNNAPSKAINEPIPPADTESRGRGIIANVQEFLARLEKFQTLRRAQQEIQQLANQLKPIFGSMMLGPEFPLVAKIKDQYHKRILLKINRESHRAWFTWSPRTRRPARS